MSIKKVDCATLSKWVDSLIGRQRVIGVQAQADRFVFAELRKAANLRLDYDITILPPKEFLQPPCERLLTFKEDEGYTSVEEVVPTILLGVHPYDVAAIKQMDELFEQDHCDTRYMKRRAATTIVAVDVQNVSSNTFAGFMGTAHVDEGFDILLTLTGEHYVADIRTDKGEAIVGMLKEADDANEDLLKARTFVWEKNEKLMKKHNLTVSPDKWPELLDKSYDNEIWDKRSEKCFSCGSCTLTCPTCYCFDVRENVDWSLKAGVRERVWDG
ncbi:MAG: 4Fe-4S dicluster domain-containing protein, partial [Lentisphaerae bacterium]|nr:4Fe-4S dicluster domain-containing protein [Lentisphaerota bacterium]